MVTYNPLDKFYKSQIGAVCARKNIIFRVKGDFNSVVLLLKKDGNISDEFYPLVKKDGYFELNISFNNGLYFYCFSLCDGRFIGLGEDYEGIITSSPTRFQLTVYDENYQVPEWLKGGVIYQIFPDRFNRCGDIPQIEKGKILHKNWNDTPCFLPNDNGQVLNNDFFGGNIKGIQDKLDYLKGIGVSAIYLNPIFKAFSNHRYDTGDFMQIDPLLGDENDLNELVYNAHKIGIKIILDGVFNHTGDDSVYFNKYGKYNSLGAYQSKQSRYYGWYNFTCFPNEYESWWGIKVLPSVNENNEDYVDFITAKNGVIDKYTRMGIDGWRLDVVDELPSNFVRLIRKSAKNVNPDTIIIGEVWEDASNKISYGVRRSYFHGEELDSVMNYPLKDAIIEFVKNKDVKRLSYTIKEQIDHYPKKVLDVLMNILSTHDTARLITALAGQNGEGKSKSELSKIFIPENQMENSKFLVKVASLLQYTLYGVPSLYYGDEVGMQGYIDPLNRKCYPWGDEDFELLSWYRFLGDLRQKYDAFIEGEFNEIYAQNGIFIFSRRGEQSELLICVNLSDREAELVFDGTLMELYTQEKYECSYCSIPNSFGVFIKKELKVQK